MNQSSNQQAKSPITRRSFLQTTATTVGAAALGSLALERFAHAAGDDTIKLALVGCGGRGSGAADQALSTKGSVKLIAMADAFRDRLDGSHNELKNRHGDRVDVSDDQKFIGFDAYKQAIALADIVILATPPGFRPIHFEEAVRQGKNIFTEKPVGVDGPGIRRFLAAAEESKTKGLKVGVGLQRHHQIGYLETIQRLHGGAIGDITSMRCYWNDAGVWVHPRAEVEKMLGHPPTEMEYQMKNWYYFVWLCGDHIVEQHIHNLDVINWVKQGHPVRCHGMGGRQVRTAKEYGQIFDHHAVEYEYADGSRCASQCEHIRGCWSSVSEHVVGTKGRCDVSGHRIEGENAWRFRGGGKNPYQQEHDDLFAAIRNNQPYNEAEYGAHSTLTAIMGRMATYSGKVIEWDRALNSEVNQAPKVYAFDAEAPVQPDANGFYPVPVPGDPDWLHKIV
ncbi:MAG: Gfo/Idh/MocA family oxidoreductase [Verrucomicrobia bacterium]|nr:Gfo/Idh/MocA family oxidoreductase [Verrucomicrobiota bacterium]